MAQCRGEAPPPAPAGPVGDPELLRPAGDTGWDSYATTMKTAFTPKMAPVPGLLRPKSTRRLGYSYSLSDPILNQTNYNDEFVWKTSCREDGIRNGTSRGVRTLKAPSASAVRGPTGLASDPRSEKSPRDPPRAGAEALSAPFPTPPRRPQCAAPWTLPKEKDLRPPPELPPPPSEEMLRALAHQFESRTRSDFRSQEEAKRTMQAPPRPSGAKSVLPQPLDTEVRCHYRVPAAIPELHNTGEFRSTRRVAAQGLVPSVLCSRLRHEERTQKLTTYSSDYGQACLDLLAMLDSFSPAQVRSYLRSVPGKDRQILERFIGSHCPGDMHTDTDTHVDTDTREHADTHADTQEQRQEQREGAARRP
ncbi:testis-expressed protein 26 [Meriones unguiculatus]|uniref:testis-expressed protein 26 n=1 Tax=Meriones unguiculatus TaxID=10047 RepID=UPI00293E73EA|nr:testis-expressed protein 26 [Meriones unguiculatus]